MHFLLTNDDGIHAPGLVALEAAVRMLPDATYTVVAPEEERSMCGHRVTTREPLLVEQHDERHYGVSGTPADCVRVALFGLHLMPDFILSGVNSGGNMGQDLPVSGTVAAAREAAYHGLPAAALSHYLIKDLTVDWSRLAHWSQQIIAELLTEPLGEGQFWNVNFPHHPTGDLQLPPRVPAQPSREPLKVSFAHQSAETPGRMIFQYNAQYKDRPAPHGTDVAVCFGGKVAVSLLNI